MEPVLVPPNSPPVCSKCGNQVTLTDTFCANCGMRLQEQTVGIGKQIWIYFVSIFLPPLGIIWTFKYFRAQNDQPKRVALIAAILTVLSTVITIWATIGIFNTVQSQVQTQLKTYQNVGY